MTENDFICAIILLLAHYPYISLKRYLNIVPKYFNCFAYFFDKTELTYLIFCCVVMTRNIRFI
jgi:hypothetical protein